MRIAIRLRLQLRRRVEANEPELPHTMPPMSRRTPLRRWAVVAAALAVGVAACTVESGVATERAEPATDPTSSEPTSPPDTESTPSDPTTPSTSESSGALQWSELSEGVETAVLEVPVDYENPDGPTFELFVARRLADDQENKIGSLLVNPGGPGFGGSDFAIFADQIYGEELLERFDIVGWDPRGTGQSEPAIDCIDDYDHYFSGTDITPDDAAEKQEIVDLAEEFAGNCVENNAEYIEFVGTNNSARDIDSIRRALGEDADQLLRVQLRQRGSAATWATLFPETVRAAVLDGAADPNADLIEGGVQQAAGFEGTLTTYLAECSDDPSCEFHNDGDAEGAFDALMLELDEEPIPSEAGRPDVTRGVALQAVAQAMYSETFWDQLSEGLADAQGGDGAGLLALYDSYYQRQTDGTWGNELEAFQTISVHGRSRASLRRGGRRHGGALHRGRSPLPAQHGRHLLLHVLPPDERPADRGHRSRCRADRRDRYHR